MFLSYKNVLAGANPHTPMAALAAHVRGTPAPDTPDQQRRCWIPVFLSGDGVFTMARPRKNPSDNRERRLIFRATDDECACIAARADQAGLSVSDYLRAVAVSGKVVVRQDAAPNVETVNQLRRIGVNLNQITRTIHTNGGRIPPELDRLCGKVGEALDRVFADGSPRRP